jgi:hypothetical protein
MVNTTEYKIFLLRTTLALEGTQGASAFSARRHARHAATTHGRFLER